MEIKEITYELETTFNKLKDKYKITFEERKQTYYNYLIARGFDEYTAKIFVLSVNENTFLYIDDIGTMGNACYKNNRIFINAYEIQDYIDTDFQTCYKKEYKFIERNVKTKKDAIVWTMCHEYAHILRLDKVNHTIDFFKTVEELFKSIQ